MAAQQPKRTAEPEPPKVQEPLPRTQPSLEAKKSEAEKKAPSKPLFKGSSTNPFAKRPGSGGPGAGV